MARQNWQVDGQGKDFGLTWNQALETGGVLVADRVDIEIELQAIQQAGAKVAQGGPGEALSPASRRRSVVIA